MPDNKKKGMAEGLMPNNSKPKENFQKGNTENDGIPSYLYYVKAMQDGNQEAANTVLNTIQNSRGAGMATDLRFLGKYLGQSSLNDIAKRNIATEPNPELKRLYHFVNENPDILNRFEYYMPQRGGMSQSLSGLR